MFYLNLKEEMEGFLLERKTMSVNLYPYLEVEPVYWGAVLYLLGLAVGGLLAGCLIMYLYRKGLRLIKREYMLRRLRKVVRKKGLYVFLQISGIYLFRMTALRTKEVRFTYPSEAWLEWIGEEDERLDSRRGGYLLSALYCAEKQFVLPDSPEACMEIEEIVIRLIRKWYV